MKMIHNKMRCGAATLAALSLGILILGARFVAAQTAALKTPGFDPKLPTLFVVGDSTARNNANGAQGWGDPLAAYFDTSKINVVNRAMAGRSSRTFTTEGRWDGVVKDLKAGDFVLLQMGHNDSGAVDDRKARIAARFGRGKSGNHQGRWLQRNGLQLRS